MVRKALTDEGAYRSIADMAGRSAELRLSLLYNGPKAETAIHRASVCRKKDVGDPVDTTHGEIAADTAEHGALQKLWVPQKGYWAIILRVVSLEALMRIVSDGARTYIWAHPFTTAAGIASLPAVFLSSMQVRSLKTSAGAKVLRERSSAFFYFISEHVNTLVLHMTLYLK